MKNLKKIIKISVMVVVSLVVIWFILYLIDNARFKKGNKPLVTLKTNTYLFNDGTVTEYNSFLYKMIIYNRTSMKENSFKAIWKKFINNNDNIYLTYKKKEKCDNITYTFYEDDTYKYNLECKYEYIVHDENKKYNIKDAIDNNIISISELEKYIDFEKQEK